MIKRIFLGALLTVIGLAGASLYMVLLTEEGIRLCVSAADRFLPGKISVDSVQGRIVNRFTLEGIRYSDEINTVFVDRILFSWRPTSLLQKELDIKALEIQDANLIFSPGEPEDSSENFSFPSFTLPLSIEVEHASIDTLTVKTAEDTPEIRVASIVLDNLSGKGSQIQIGKFEVSSEQYRVAAHGEIQTSDVFSTRLTVDYSLSSTGFSPVAGNGKLKGSLDELEYETHLLAPFIGTSRGILKDLAGNLTWKGTFQADQIILSRLNKEWPELTFTGSQLSGEGSLSSYSLQAKSTTAYDSYQDMSFSLELQSGTIGKPSAEDGAARSNSLDELTYKAHFLSPFVGTLEGDIRELSGDFIWRGSVQTDQVILSQVNKDWPEIIFAGFNTSGEGDLSSYSFTVTANTASYVSFQNIALSTTINGDGSGLQITDARLEQNGSVLNGKGQLAWNDQFTWQANLTGEQINPALYDQSWPGNLDLEFFTSGQVNNGKVKTEIELVKLAGELRDFPVTAKGKIEIDGKDLTVDTFSIQSSDSFLQASGRLSDSNNLIFLLESSRLETLWPNLSGSMEASGRITGTRQKPEFQFDLSGDRIVLGETKISDLIASGEGEFTPEGSIKAALTATEVSLAATVLDTLAVGVEGTLQDHVIEASVDAPDALALLKLEGGYYESSWNGFISNLAIETEIISEWQLQERPAIVLSSENADIGTLCLVGEQSALVCIDGQYNSAGQWGVKAEITALPADLFRNMQTKFKDLGGFFSGTASIKGQGGEILYGDLNISADDLALRLDLLEDYSRDIAWKKNGVHAVLDGSSAEVKIDSILEDGSSFTVEAVLSGIETLPFSIENTGVEGGVNFDILDLQPLSAISYPDIEPYGILRGDMKFSGKLLQPDVLGHAQLEQGKMVLPSLGITVKDLEMQFDGKDNRIRMNVTATSGTGSLSVAGYYTLLLEGERKSEFAISGENFEVINLPEARINVSPDLKMKISKQRGELQGNILITEAYIFPENLSGTVTSTKDVVFVDDQAKKEQAAWPFYTNITLKADENVRVNAYGLKGLVVGQLQIIDQPAKAATGEGSLNVRDGTFSIYGRQLKIVKGRILYSGNPLDNPGIDVRAESVAGGVTTGIQVSGFLREPDITFYSTPPMEKDEIIQRLLMNTSLVGSDEEEGFLGSVASDTGLDPIASAVKDIKEGLRVDDVKIETGKKSDDLSLVIGTWLTPRLYISYGKNLLKESNNFNTRYVLGRGFSLETETGTTESGFDFMYEIDK